MQRKVYSIAGTPPAAPIFSALSEKMGEKRGAGLRFGAFCGYSSGKYLIFGCYEHTKSPYGQ